MTHLTPLSQRMAVERYKAKQLAQGMIKVEVWINSESKQELLDFARLKRAEYELENHYVKAKLARVELEINGVPYEKTT